MAIKSLLKSAAQSLPDGTIKGKAIPNNLKKAGVKDEELKFAELNLEPETRYSTEEIVDRVGDPADNFKTVDGEGTYERYSLSGKSSKPNSYREKITTFSQAKSNRLTVDDKKLINRLMTEPDSAENQDLLDEVRAMWNKRFPGEELNYYKLQQAADDKYTPSRYTSSHFPEVKDYLMHSRVFDATWNGKHVRVIEEVQSDLHQAGRKSGYANSNAPEPRGQFEISREIDELYEEYDIDGGILISQLSDMDGPPHVIQELRRLADELDAPSPSTIPESPFEKTWLRKGLEREVVDAINEGAEEVAIPIKGSVQQLHRGAGVQKWYETKVQGTVKKLAKSMGADFEMVTRTDKKQIRELEVELVMARQHGDTGDIDEARLDLAKAKEGVTYAVIRPKLVNDLSVPRVEKPSFSLYSTPVAGGMAAYLALKEGYSEDEIIEKLRADGHDDDDIVEALDRANKIKAAVAEGYSEDEIKQFMQGEEPTVVNREAKPQVEKSWWESAVDLFTQASEKVETARQISEGELPGVKPEDAVDPAKVALGKRKLAYQQVVGLDEDMSLPEFVEAIKLIRPHMGSVLSRTSAFAGNSTARQTSEKLFEAQKQMITKFAAENGVTLEYRDPEGGRSDIGAVTDLGTWWAKTEGGEWVEANPGFWDALNAEKGEIAGAVGGGIAAGSMAARTLPKNPWVLGIGVPAASAFGAMGGGALGTQFDYLNASMKLNAELDAEIAWHKSTTAAEASLLGDSIGYPLVKLGAAGWQGVVKMKNALVNSDLLGAKSALKELMILSDDEIDHIVTQTARVMELPENSPDKEVMSFVMTEPGGEEIMKEVGSISPTAHRNVAKAIDSRAKDLIDSAERLKSGDVSPAMRQDLDNYVTDTKQFYKTVIKRAQDAPGTKAYNFDYEELAIQPVLDTMRAKITDPAALERFGRRADVIGQRVDSRTFTDLLDLRQLVNEFRFGRGMKKAVDQKGFSDLMTKIDRKIKEGAEQVFDDPKEWLDQFATAKIRYAEMKTLEKNVLFKMLQKKGVPEDALVRSLTKYITASDETWSEVLNQLPAGLKARAEGATVKALVDKHTAGQGMQAIDFPSLSDSLAPISLTTKDARALKASIDELATVFKNDVPLAQFSGGIPMPTVQQGLTDNPFIKAKYSFVAKLWKQSQKFFPGKDGRHAAMLAKAARVLENPLNVRTTKELMDGLGSQTMMAQDLLELQRAASLEAADNPNSPLVRLYGDGPLKSPEGSGLATKVHLSRIASPDIIQQVIDEEALHKGDAKAIERALKQRGYTAMASGTNKVKIL
jgi:hypothetical protein